MPAIIKLDMLPEPIGAYIAAYNAFDVPAMAALLADDVTFRDIADEVETTSTKGKAAFIEVATAACRYFSERKQTVRNAITVADTTLVEIDYTATCAMNLPNGWREGQQITLVGCSLFQFSEGLIVRLIDESRSDAS